MATGEPDDRLPRQVNVLPGIFSPADLRHLSEIVRAFELDPVLLPDYADRMDGPTWDEYRRIPEGGTTLERIATMGRAAASIELGVQATPATTAGKLLATQHGVPHHALPMPIGINAVDALMRTLGRISGMDTPQRFADERGRLIDSYIDAHKYVFEKRVVVFGEEDSVAAMTGWLAEVGCTPVLCASGGKSGKLAELIGHAAPMLAGQPHILEGVDFEEIADAVRDVEPDLLVGHSKGYKLARALDVPLMRVGLPVHDRFGAGRLLHVGYAGTQRLFDQLVNFILERKQAASAMGYSYL